MAPARAQLSKQQVVITSGETLHDGVVIEPILLDGDSTQLQLASCDGEEIRVAPRMAIGDRLYEAAQLDPSILRATHMPDRVAQAEPLKKLWHDIARTIATFTALPESQVTLSTSFVMATWFIMNFSTAPWLAVSGPDALVGSQLLSILHCLCRRALQIACQGLATIRSLPSGWHFSLIAREPSLSPQMQRLLRVALTRGQFVPAFGQLLDYYGTIATFTNEPPPSFTGGPCAIEIPAMPSATPPKLLTVEQEHQLARDFQPRLVAALLRNHAEVVPSAADGAKLHHSMRELGRNLAACATGDADSKAAVLDALAAQDRASESSRWVDPQVVVVEALLAFTHELKTEVYIGEVARRASGIARLRGARREWEPRAVGAQLRMMGIHIGRRDRKGYPVELNASTKSQLHRVAAASGIPAKQRDCEFCAAKR